MTWLRHEWFRFDDTVWCWGHGVHKNYYKCLIFHWFIRGTDDSNQWPLSSLSRNSYWQCTIHQVARSWFQLQHKEHNATSGDVILIDYDHSHTSPGKRNWNKRPWFCLNHPRISHDFLLKTKLFNKNSYSWNKTWIQKFIFKTNPYKFLTQTGIYLIYIQTHELWIIYFFNCN